MTRVQSATPSSVFDSELLQHLWSTEELRAIFSESSRIQKWLDYEVALARSQAELGMIPSAAAVELASKAIISSLDITAVASEVRRTKHPLVPALRAVQNLCSKENGEFLHYGPTTQDVLDTGMMLQIKEAHVIFKRDLVTIGRELARLANEHKNTAMAGRTHGVQGAPYYFRP